MMDKTNKSGNATSDDAIVDTIGAFIRYHRLEQNKTQSQLAEEAGINRSTLAEFEKGKRSNIITLIQLLRVLNLLYVMEQFKISQQISTIHLAEMEQSKRKRAAKTKQTNKKIKFYW